MRNLVVLLLVLGMASLANAGLLQIANLSGSSNVTAPIGSVQLQLLYTGAPDIVSFDVKIADISNAVITAGNRNAAIDVIVDAGGGFTELSATQDSAGVLAAGQLATFTVNYTGGVKNVGLEIVAMLDGAWGLIETTQIQGATITPEPATLAILGLGGLLLRRKK